MHAFVTQSHTVVLLDSVGKRNLCFPKVLKEAEGTDGMDLELVARSKMAIWTGHATLFEGKVVKSRGMTGISRKRFYAKLTRDLADVAGMDPSRHVQAEVLAFANACSK
jgi:hypothetical protein